MDLWGLIELNRAGHKHTGAGQNNMNAQKNVMPSTVSTSQTIASRAQQKKASKCWYSVQNICLHHVASNDFLASGSTTDLWPPWPLQNKSWRCHSRCQSCQMWRSMNNVGQRLNLSPHTQDSISLTPCPADSILTCFWGWATLQITGNSITHYIRQQKPHPTSTNNSSDTRRCALSTCQRVLRLHSY